MSARLPAAVSALEACKLIAGSHGGHGRGGYQRGLSKAEMVTLARTACVTEGVSWDNHFDQNAKAVRR